MLAQGVSDPIILPLIAQGTDATAHQAILVQIVTLIQAATAKVAAEFQAAHSDAKVVYYDAE